jgi:hypothetical protein
VTSQFHETVQPMATLHKADKQLHGSAAFRRAGNFKICRDGSPACVAKLNTKWFVHPVSLTCSFKSLRPDWSPGIGNTVCFRIHFHLLVDVHYPSVHAVRSYHVYLRKPDL